MATNVNKMSAEQAIVLLVTDPQAGYREAADILQAELTRLQEENNALRSELEWAWDNLAKEEATFDVLGELCDYDICTVCRRPSYEHKTSCNLKTHEEFSNKLINGEK